MCVLDIVLEILFVSECVCVCMHACVRLCVCTIYVLYECVMVIILIVSYVCT